MLPDRDSPDDSARPASEWGGLASRVASPGDESSRPAWKVHHENELADASTPRAFDSTGVPPTASLKPSTNEEDTPFGHLGRYRLERKIGRGGMGTVWLGFDPRLGRPVAIKVLRGDFRGEAGAVDEFLEEGRCLARLNHPDILPVYDFGAEDGICYLVSEYVPGGTLAEQMRREPPSYSDAAAIVAHVAEAAHFAHLRGVVHRDIKPGNILMRTKDRPLLADFGLAIAEEAQLHSTPGTLGTYAYMSPEQLRGDSQFVDGRADIYSLGVILYELLTGRLPHLADSGEAYQELVLKRDARPPRSIREDIPPALEAICLKCLARAPADRYTTASDLAQALRAASSQPAPLPRQTPWSAVAIAVATGALLWLGSSLLNGPAAPDSSPTITSRSEPPEPPNADALLVRELPLASHPLTTWDITPDGRSVRFLCDDLMLFQLGELEEGEDLSFSVEIQQTHWNGGLGLFWGGGPAEGNPARKKYEYFQLYPRVLKDFRLRNALVEYADHADRQTREDEQAVHWLPEVTGMSHRLGVEIREGRVTRLIWDELDLSKLIERRNSRSSTSPAQGAFGLIADHTHGVFSQARVNGKMIRFVAPEAATVRKNAR